MVQWPISAILGVFHVAPSSTDSLIYPSLCARDERQHGVRAIRVEGDPGRLQYAEVGDGGRVAEHDRDGHGSTTDAQGSDEEVLRPRTRPLPQVRSGVSRWRVL